MGQKVSLVVPCALRALPPKGVIVLAELVLSFSCCFGTLKLPVATNWSHHHHHLCWETFSPHRFFFSKVLHKRNECRLISVTLRQTPLVGFTRKRGDEFPSFFSLCFEHVPSRFRFVVEVLIKYLTPAFQRSLVPTGGNCASLLLQRCCCWRLYFILLSSLTGAQLSGVLAWSRMMMKGEGEMIPFPGRKVGLFSYTVMSPSLQTSANFPFSWTLYL